MGIGLLLSRRSPHCGIATRLFLCLRAKIVHSVIGILGPLDQTPATLVLGCDSTRKRRQEEFLYRRVPDVDLAIF